MTFEIEGVLHKVYDTESKSSSFQTREFVITTEGTYPQFVKFQLTQDKCGIIDGYKEGEKVKVFFDLRGREWQGKYFTNLNAWKLEKTAMAQASFSEAGMPSEPPVFDSFDASEKNNFQADIDDLPF